MLRLKSSFTIVSASLITRDFAHMSPDISATCSPNMGTRIFLKQTVRTGCAIAARIARVRGSRFGPGSVDRLCSRRDLKGDACPLSVSSRASGYLRWAVETRLRLLALWSASRSSPSSIAIAFNTRRRVSGLSLLFGQLVDEQRAFNERAVAEATEVCMAAEIENLRKCLPPKVALLVTSITTGSQFVALQNDRLVQCAICLISPMFNIG